MKIELKLKPFASPDFVFAETKETFTRREGPSFALRDVKEEALSDLCDQFRKDVFLKASKTDSKTK